MGSVGEAEQLLTAIDVVRGRERADPLSYWKCKSWAQRALLSCWLMFRRLREVYWHASNSGGKTSGGAILAVCLLQRREVIDGIRLPEMPARVDGLLLVHSYKQASASSIKALREALGEWPHHEVPASDDCPGAIYVMPMGCKVAKWCAEAARVWSKLYVIPRDGEIPDGMRLHFAWADEPPDEKMWREIRHRGIAGLRFIRFITATPKLKRFWLWLLSDYQKRCGEEPGRENDATGGLPWQKAVKGGYLRIQSSIYDNKALTAEDVKRAEEEAETDPEKDARLYGDHVDSTGSRPWPYDRLLLWRSRCREPETERFVVQERSGRPGKDQRLQAEVTVTLETWAEYDPLDSYIVLCDPAKGIKDDTHDPDGLHVWSVRRNALVARVNEYIGAFLLGKCAARIARLYGNAQVEPFVTGGFGTGLLAGLIDGEGYTNIYRDKRTDRVDASVSADFGYTETNESIDEFVGALERAMVTDSCGIWSAPVVDALMACVRDEKGKVVAEVGGHARFRRPEDFVLAGRAQVRIAKIKGGEPLVDVPVLNFAETLRREFGRDVYEHESEVVVAEEW